MKCPKCSLVTFDHLQQCPRCESSFSLARRLTRTRPRGRRIVIPRPGVDLKSDPERTERVRKPRLEATRTPAARTEATPTEVAPESRSREEHAADAASIKERMIRASQARRQRDQVLVAEVDPVLPDWYEPEREPEVDEPVPARGAERR